MSKKPSCILRIDNATPEMWPMLVEFGKKYFPEFTFSNGITKISDDNYCPFSTDLNYLAFWDDKHHSFSSMNFTKNMFWEDSVVLKIIDAKELIMDRLVE